MLEVLKYFRANGYKTYIVTGGGQELGAHGSPNRSTASLPSKWSARWVGPSTGYGKDGKPFLTKEPSSAERQRRGQARRHPSHDRPPALRSVR